MILCLAFYELDYLDFIPPRATLHEYVEIAKKKLPAANVSTVNGILRTYLRIGKSLKPEKKFKYADTQLSIKYSYPEWLIKRWLAQWDRQFVEEMCRAMNERPVFDLRINKRKIDSTAFEEMLFRAQIAFTVSPYISDVYRITDIQKLQQAEILAGGFCSVQDESGLLAIRLLLANERETAHTVLDFCAAPGSKFTAFREQHAHLKVTGLELKFHRLLKIRENCLRLDLPDSGLVAGDARCAPFKTDRFDLILVDAPCSGLGTIQKHPDIKWRRSLDEILDFQRLQSEILSEAGRLLKPGGTMVYCTCTMDPSENEEVIKQFLENHQNKYRLVPPPAQLSPFISDSSFLRTFPHTHGMEGSFAARLKKF